MKFITKLCPIFVLLLVLATNAFALSASIGNARMILYPEIAPGETAVLEKSILVRNINNVSVMIHLDAIQDIENMTEILDNDFVLEPLQEKDARFILTIEEPGRYEGSIGVSFAVAEGDQQGSGGVGLLSNIIIVAREGNQTTSQVNQTTAENQTQQQEEKGPMANPVVGFVIMVIIIAIGLIVFLKFSKRGKHAKKKPRKKPSKRKKKR